MIAAEGDRLPLRVWDPCCGAGDISTVLQRHGREVVPTDLIDRGYGQGGVDFLLQRTALARAIVTNPPFKRAEAFLRHAAELGIEYVAFLHNPGGLSKAYHQARALARAAAPEMMARLIELGLTAEDERVASVCLVAGLDRAGVKPIDYDPAQDVTPPSWDPGALTDEEREDLKALLVKMIGKGKP